MNKVDIYVNDFRLDLFDDEEISINLSVQNVQDISKVFTDFTQGFTVPASPRNNEILQHYYNANITSSVITTETGGSSVWNSIGITWNSWTTAWNAGSSSTSVVNTFDGRFRQPARIEINSLPFRTGVIEIENVQLKGTEPYAYTMTFYGDVVTLTDLFGEDYLYDLNFSAYDHSYDATTILDYFSSDNNGTDLIYPLMSPEDNWYYDAGAGPFTGINLAPAHTKLEFYMLKPALRVEKILDAVEAKYGITFTGSFISSDPFTKLYLWLHRFEGYLFGGSNDIAWQLIDFDDVSVGTEFNLSTETWSVQSDGTYTLTVGITDADEDYELGLFSNGRLVSSALKSASPSSTVFTVFSNVLLYAGNDVQLFIRPQSVVSALNYECSYYDAVDSTPTTRFLVSQTAPVSYTFNVVVQDIMPEIKVKDFLAGIIKMHNLVIVPNSATSFLLQPLEEWYAAGTDQDYQTYFDITEYAVNRPPLYREIEFKYQDTEQILGFQYQKTNNVGFGDLRANFSFDGDEFIVELPFECPLFERLTSLDSGDLTNILTYKSITSEVNEDGTYNPYLGAPILFYGHWSNPIDAHPIGFITDPVGPSVTNVNEIWYCNTSSSPTSAALSNSICFGADIDPYHLVSVNNSLYNTYWSDYITDLYAKSRRLVQVEAVLPIGKIITMNLKNAVIWNNAKYIVNSAQVNMTTGKATFELLNVV